LGADDSLLISVHVAGYVSGCAYMHGLMPFAYPLTAVLRHCLSKKCFLLISTKQYHLQCYCNTNSEQGFGNPRRRLTPPAINQVSYFPAKAAF